MNVLRRRKWILVLLLAMVLAGAAGITAYIRNQGVGESEIPEITIYLDHENQMLVRAMVAMYQNLSEVAQYSGEDDKYPLINWRMVDKSALSAEEYRAELLEELEDGKGPDLVFMDAYSCENPADFMEAGYLSGLNAWLESDSSVFEASHFLPGMSEAGELAGEQYFIPLSVDVPVLLTTRERLEKAGISEEELCDAEAVFAAAAAYQQQTGGMAFDSGAFLEELPRYIGSEEEWSAQLLSIVRELKERDLGESDAVEAAKAFAAGEYLFLTAGIDDYRCMAAQVSMLPEGEEILLVPLCRTDGSLQAVIRQAVAVNHNSPNQAAAQAALNAFCQKLTDNCAANLPALSFSNWNNLLSEVIRVVNIPGQRTNAFDGNLSWRYTKIVKKFMESVICQPFALPEDNLPGGADSEKQLTVMVPDFGWNEDGLLYRWIATAARAYEAERGIHVEICEGETMWEYEKLLLMDTAADITVLYKTLVWLGYEDTVGHVLDYRSLSDDGGISELPWKESVQKAAGQSALPGIPYIEEKNLVSSFIVSARTGLLQEALEFITFCLNSDAYGEMLKCSGEVSVLEE